MIRFVLIIFFAIHSLFGSMTCLDKVRDAHAIQNNALYIPVKKQQILVYSETKPYGKIIKYDKFLSLYLIEDKGGFLYRFETPKKMKKTTYLITNTQVVQGQITKKQIGINKLGHYSIKPSSYPAILSDSCCYLVGIVTKDGVIEKEYIERFLDTHNGVYGDIGISVYDKQAAVIIEEVNPFLNNKLKIDDIILKYDSVHVLSSASFMKKVLFSTPDTYHNLLIKRDGKNIEVKVVIVQKESGGDKSYTFLETRGLVFDKNLRLKKFVMKKYGLKIGDKLISVNGVSVKTQKDVRKKLSSFKAPFSLLFERYKFQFFVKIK